MDVRDVFWGISSFICNKELLLAVFIWAQGALPNRKTACMPRTHRSRLAAAEVEVQEMQVAIIDSLTVILFSF